MYLRIMLFMSLRFHCGHVSDTVHSQEGEILGELDEVSGDLAIGGPCCPLFGSRPLKGFDPAAGADSGDNAISVT